MPPKKLDGSPKKGGTKTRGRPKKAKRILKTPSIVKLKLNLPSATVADPIIQSEVNKGATAADQIAGSEDNKGAPAADQIAGSEDNKVLDVEEANKPVTKNKTIVKRKYTKELILSENQKVTKKGAPVKKRVRAKGAAKSEKTLDTACASQENTECDIPKINLEFYKILLANQVVHAQFSNKPKYITEQPINQGSKENKTTLKNNSNLVLEKKVATKKPAKTKKSGQPNSVTKEKTSKELKCIQSKEVENNADFAKNTDISNKPNKLTKSRVRKITTSEKSGCKPHTNSKDGPREVENNADYAKNTDISNKPKKLTKRRVRKITTSEKSGCKPDTNSKDGPSDTDNTITIDTKKAAQSAKPKSKLSLKRKTEKAKPETQKISKGVQKASKMNNSRKPINNKTMTMVTNKSIENVNIDKRVDSNIELASLANSSKSWIRDISSPSNSSLITVCSNGLHCFDNKIPVVQLRKINKKKMKKEKTMDETDASLGLQRRLSRTSSSSSDQTKTNLEHNKVDNNCEVTNFTDVARSLRLSTSSTSSSSSSSNSSSSSSGSTCNSDTRKNGTSVLEEQNPFLKIFDLNRIKLSNNTYQMANEPSFLTNVTIIQDKIFRNDVLKEETELLCICQNIATLEIEDVDKYVSQREVQKTTEISCPKTPETFYSQDSEIIQYEHVNGSVECSKQNTSNSQQYSPAKEVDAVAANAKAAAANEIEEKIDGKYNKSYTSFVDNDDDDALSLFAESLTGLESCRKSSTFNSEISNSEEYVPQPVKYIEPRTQINYQPTKITNKYEIPKCKSLNKKQKQDPIPSLMDFDCSRATRENAIYEDRTGSFTEYLPKSTNIVNKITQESNKPRLMASIHRPSKGLKSSVFKSYCFFHMVYKCKKFDKCSYTHAFPTVSHVKKTLERLSEDWFIQEYMLVRNFPPLRRKYGPCFVEECIRRDLTRILVEIAIDFVIKCTKNSAEDNALKSEIVDSILMYLNKVDLSICEDLLLYVINCTGRVYTGRVLLCDYFMSVIAMSQNFSRFKSIFINLTDFMYQKDRTFSVDVAESILERLCILPYDDLLARAFLNILKKTDVTVYSNARMPDLERLLQVSNEDLYHELNLMKDQALVSQPVLNNHHKYEPLHVDSDRINTNFGHTDRNLIRNSPDLTNLGNASKSPIETVFKRTVNTEKLQQLGIGNKSNTQDTEKPCMNWKKPNDLRIGKNDNMNRKAAEIKGKAKQSFKNWENRSIFDNCFMRNNPNASNIGRQRPPFKRHSDWSLGGSPTKFNRNGGPSYFQRDL